MVIMDGKCPYHDDLAREVTAIKEKVEGLPLLQKDMEYLRRDVETILARFSNHVNDAEKEGGWHQRMLIAENTISNLQTYQKWWALGAGVVGGLIGAAAPNAVRGIASLLGV
jgi:3-dehydroquinate synthetase